MGTWGYQGYQGCVDFRHEITEKGLKRTKIVANSWKKEFLPVFFLRAATLLPPHLSFAG